MSLQVVGRIIGGAKRLHAKFFQDSVRAEVIGGQKLIGALPNCGRGFFIEQLIDSEIADQLEMGPMVERIAQSAGHGRCPGQEFFIGRGIARAVAFGNSVGTHRAPFVVIALEPNLEEVAEAAIGGDILRREMAVIIENRLVCGVLAVEPPPRFIFEQEIGVDESHLVWSEPSSFFRNCTRIKKENIRWVTCQGYLARKVQTAGRFRASYHFVERYPARGPPLPPGVYCKSVIRSGFKSFVSEECDSKVVTGAFLWKSVKLKGLARETGEAGLSEAVGESSLKEVENMLGLLALRLLESAAWRISDPQPAVSKRNKTDGLDLSTGLGVRTKG